MKANYHTHTSRCNHATGTEREYIETAIENGIQILGFSDHTPYMFDDEYSAYIRMKMNELEGYVTTILDLKKEYQKDIQIHLGLEVEYFAGCFDELYRELEQYPLEYLLLATHWYGNSHKTEPYFGIYTEDEKVLANYYEQVIEGMKRGCFTYLAHPDLINYPSNTTLYERTMRKVCQASKRYQVPLEINLRGLRFGKQYPNPDFWRIAGEEQCKVIIGCDAHEPEELVCQDVYQEAMKYVEKNHLLLLDEIELRKPVKLFSKE